MTIENNLKRIADALEALVASQGIVPEQLDLVDDAPGAEKPEPEKKPAAKKTSKKKTSKKVSKKKTGKKVGKPKEEVETDLTIKDDVRPVLKRLREEVSHAAVKSLLKKHGASTLQQLDPSKFENIIADALNELGEDPDDDDLLGDDDL
jgi:hypothetical protein